MKILCLHTEILATKLAFMSESDTQNTFSIDNVLGAGLHLIFEAVNRSL
jgi:hypothetical protein